MIYREKDEEDVKDISTDKKRQNKYQQVIISDILFRHKISFLKEIFFFCLVDSAKLFFVTKSINTQIKKQRKIGIYNNDRLEFSNI